MLRALSSIASAHLEARAKRRTDSILSQLPESVQKDIGWRWSPSRQEASTKVIRWDLI